LANKYAAYGAQIGFGSPIVTVASVKSISGPKLSAEQLDVTTHDSASSYREFVASFKDSGDVQITVVFDPAEASHGSSTGLLSLFESGAKTAFKITFHSTPASNLSFSGIVTGFEWSNQEVNSILEASITIKVSGPVTLD
jgi:predicted secreted protein